MSGTDKTKTGFDLTGPIVILVEPQLGENIGMAARAMGNFGLTRLRIVNPPPGATYLFDPTLRAEFQTLPLRAVAESSAGTLSWEIDGRTVGTSSADRALDWPLARGEHTLAVSDGRNKEEVVILVK